MIALQLAPDSSLINAQAGYQLWKDSFGIDSGEKGIHLLGKSLKLDPKSAYAHILLGKIYSTPGTKIYDLPQARKEFREALRLDPGDSQAHFSLALTYLDGHLYQEAKTELDAFRAMTPDLSPTYTAFVQGQINHGLRK